MKIEQIQAKIKKKEEDILVLKSKLSNINLKNSTSKWVYIKEIDKEVEIEVHDKNKSYNDLKQIYGDNFETMLLTRQECEIILKNKEISKILKMDGSSTNDDFFIQQYDENDKKNGYVAAFCRVWGGSYFWSDWGSGVAGGFRGVRFCRKKI